MPCNPNIKFASIKCIIIKKKYRQLIIIIGLIISLNIIISEKSYKFNKFYQKRAIELINLNYTKSQYKIIGLKYLNKIKKSKLNNITNKINTPKITIIIPIYNCQKTIELTYKSIHFQNFKEIEIILVNDKSPDNSSLILDKLQGLDRRITIINNKKNMGTLYSRSIGALNANGEYIIGLDNDDLFLFEKTLETIYLNAKINDFDIAEMRSFNIKSYNPKYNQIRDGYFIHHQNNLILHQPELGRFSISYKNKLAFTDHYIWGKCIKSSIYKEAVKLLGPERYSHYNCWTEDLSIVFILFNIAKSFIFLNLFGIFHILSKSTTTNLLSKHKKLLTDIFYLGILFDFSKDDFITKKFVAQFALSFPKRKIKKLDDKNKIYFKSIIKKLIKCKYITQKYKDKIIQKFH